MFPVYILENAAGHFYIGNCASTAHTHARLGFHNNELLSGDTSLGHGEMLLTAGALR